MDFTIPGTPQHSVGHVIRAFPAVFITSSSLWSFHQKQVLLWVTVYSTGNVYNDKLIDDNVW